MYFKNHPSVNIIANVSNFSMIPYLLTTTAIDVLILDLELEGLSSIFEIKTILKTHPTTKIIIFTGLSEQIYASLYIKVGVSAYKHKKEKLAHLGDSIVKIHSGVLIMNETLQKNLDLTTKQHRSNGLNRKLSNREVEVLRYLGVGKTRNEIVKISNKTIATFKARLLIKLHAKSTVDLLNKAKILKAI
ncbi:MAG: response regulator transcription factor [Nonlabens sp.]|uniref:LuxR C-terminal-related transcriptional regulator n=1 Tax=Nonlabens sp. TaxID=1888209 RepID=UPI0035A710D5